MNFYSEDNIWAPSRQELSDFNGDGKWIQSPLTAIEENKRVKITIMTGPAYEPPEDIEDIMRDFHSNGTEVPYDIEALHLHIALTVLDRLEELRKAEVLRRSEIAVDENNNDMPQRIISSLMKKMPSNGATRGLFPNGATRGLFPNGAVRGIFPNGAVRGLFANGAMRGQIPNGVERGPRCVFCTKNGEEDVNHRLKDEHGKTICPVLRKFKCRLCGAFGDNSHTQKYCPKNPLTKGDPVSAGMPPGLLPSIMTFK